MEKPNEEERKLYETNRLEALKNYRARLLLNGPITDWSLSDAMANFGDKPRKRRKVR